MKSRLVSALFLFACIGTASSSVVFNSLSTYTEDFNGFRGTETTLPAGFSFSGDGDDIFRGEFDSSSDEAGDFTGIMATTSDQTNFSITWRESTGDADLDDGRLILAITNNTGFDITGFQVSYSLQTWVNGRRDNELRLKYDTFLDSGDAGRGIFDTDIWPRGSAQTLNPNHTPIDSNGDQFVLNGQANGNFVPVSGFVDLTSLLIDEENPSAGFFGPLGQGETAYFRWQISNANLTAGNRSALGIDNLSITPVPEPTTALLGALGLLALLRRRHH